MRYLLALLFICTTLLVGSAAAQDEFGNLTERFQVTFATVGTELPVNGDQNDRKLIYGQDFAEILFDCDPGSKFCEINRNVGGDIRIYQFGAYAAKLSDKEFRVNEVCASGCAWFVDYARKKVCLNESAVLFFHQGRKGVKPDGTFEKWFTPDHNIDVFRLVSAHGGFRHDKLTKVLANQMTHIFRKCKNTDSIAAVR